MKISPVIIFFSFSMFILLAAMHVRAQTANWEWAKCGNGNGDGECMAKDSLGNIYIAGVFKDSLSFDTIKLLGNPTWQNTYIVKYDESGKVIWAKCSMGQTAWPFGITSDGQGNIYLTGFFGPSPVCFGSDTLTSSGSFDVFLAKYDSNGNIIWVRSLGGGGDDIARGVAPDNSGNVLICGNFSSPQLVIGGDTLFDYMVLGSEAFVAKFDSNGNPIWARTSLAFGDGSNGSSSVAVDFSDNVYMTGTFSSVHISFGNLTLNNSPILGDDVFLVKYNSTGNVKWLTGATGWGDDEGISVSTNSSDRIYLTGNFTSQILMLGGDTVIHPIGLSEVFFAQLDSNGHINWAKAATSGTSFVTAYSMCVDSQGNLYSSGSMSLGEVTFDAITLQTSNGPDPMYIVEFNSNGQAIFGTSLTSGGDDWSGIVATTPNIVYVGGDYYQDNLIIGSDTLVLTGNETPFIAKLGISSLEGIPEIDEESSLVAYPNPFDDILNVETKDNHPSEIILYDLSSRKLLQQEFTNFTSLNLQQLPLGFYLCEVILANGQRAISKVLKQ